MEARAQRSLVINYRANAKRMLEGSKEKKRGAKDASRIANISAIAPVDDDLWTASDEGTAIERLNRDDMGYARAQDWALAELFPGFASACEKAVKSGKAGKRPEADLEGIAFDAKRRRLWLVGSHCRGRGPMTGVKPEALRKGIMHNLDAEPLRTLLGFVPMARDGSPVKGAGLALPFDKAAGSLRAAVKEEGGHLAEALKWPSKENGFDIEGIAVDDTEVLLGLRGPAAGGFAVVMRLSVKIGAKGLSLRRRKGACFFLSYLQLNGLGVRDLFRHGEDVLVLAGPTMDLDGPFALYRWRGAFAHKLMHDEVLGDGNKRLEFVFDFLAPKRRLTGRSPEASERPESIALVGGNRLLVVHDRPAPWRLQPRGMLKADLFHLPGRARPPVA